MPREIDPRIEDAALKLYVRCQSVANKYSRNFDDRFLDEMQSQLLTRVTALIKNGTLTSIVEESLTPTGEVLNRRIQGLATKVARMARIDAVRKIMRTADSEVWLGDDKTLTLSVDPEEPVSQILELISQLPPMLRSQGTEILGHIYRRFTNLEGATEMGLSVATYRRLKKSVIDALVQRASKST